MSVEIENIGAEPPAHIKPVLDAIYKALVMAPENSLLLAVIRTPDDLAFVSNGEGKEIDDLLVELMLMIKGGKSESVAQ